MNAIVAKSADGAHRFLTSCERSGGRRVWVVSPDGGVAHLDDSSCCGLLRTLPEVRGRSLSDTATKLACLEVFALGGAKHDDDGVDTGYFAVRAALAGAMTEAAKYLAEHGVSSAGAPVLVRFLAKIASRYSIQVSEKAAAQAIPLLGAAGGATINLLFMDHFQSMARGHFIVRRLERTYGKELIRETYQGLASKN